MSKRLILSPVLAVVLGLSCAGLAQAQPDYAGPPASDEVVVTPPYLPPGAELRAERVFYADLDMSTRAGAYTLMGRINAAAGRVCSPEPATHTDFNDRADYDRCMDEAVGRAVDNVGAPALSDLYQYGGRDYASYSRRGYGY